MLGTTSLRRAHALALMFGCWMSACGGTEERTVRHASVDGGVDVWSSLCTSGCNDLPAAPIFDTTQDSAPPANAPALFGARDNFAGPGPCVLEPQLSYSDQEPGALFPRNWLRPRFRFTPAGDENLWEIRISAVLERNELVAYTTRTTWAIPKEIWQALSANAIDAPITVTIRGVNQQRPKQPSGVRGTFTIAPAEASGRLVYWATTASDVGPTTSKLVGFDVGDEAVIDALTIAQVGERDVRVAGGRELRGKYDNPYGVAPGAAQCIGCHVSTPDGAAVAFTDHWPWSNLLASIEEGSVGARPSYLTPFAELLLDQPWLGMQTFSSQYFWPGNRLVVTVYSPRNTQNGGVGFSDGAPYPSRSDGLAWIDLEAQGTFSADPMRGDVEQQLNSAIMAQRGKAFDLLKLDGETRSAATPAWSHDGTFIVYTSADVTQDGRISGNNQEVDLHLVPFNARLGGKVRALAGASEPHVAEYYPALSPDDSVVAFNRVAKLDGAPIYYRPDGEIYVVPAAGGQAQRLAANDPPKCGGQTSPGVINSWPKWSPGFTLVDSRNVEFGPGPRTYYWLVFSSARAYEGQFQVPKNQYSPSDTRSSQLYITGVVYDHDSRQLQTHAGIYIWNQDPKTSNLTPAWDDFKLPPVVPPD